MPGPIHVSLACARIVVELLMDDFAGRPLGHDNLLHVNRLTTGGNEIHRAFIERHIVANTGRRHIEPFSFLDPAQELLLSLNVDCQSFRRRGGIILHGHVLVIELVHRIDELALPDMAQKIL
jgi:hypothetical protein